MEPFSTTERVSQEPLVFAERDPELDRELAKQEDLFRIKKDLQSIFEGGKLVSWLTEVG